MTNTNLDDVLGSAEQAEESVAETSSEAVEVKEPEVAKAEKVEKTVEKTEESDKEPDKKVLVPHAAFHEERERRKELQKRVAEQEEFNKRLEERQTKILEALAARNTQAEPEYVDPLAALESEVKTIKGAFQKSAEQLEAEKKAWEAEQRLVSKYRASIEAYAKDAPDFMDARNYLVNDKIKELKALDFSEEEIAAEIKAIERNIVERAYSREKNPAEVIHALAKEKGYKVKAPEKKVEDIDKGLKASKSLGSTGGKNDNDTTLESLSPSELADMTDDEFNALFTKLEKQSSRRK